MTDALDDFILDRAILAGALELLPQAMATIGIVPLQTDLVYRIGQRTGRTLDVGQITDLAATVGIASAAQMIEGLARRAVGGTVRGLLGGLIGGVMSPLASAATSTVATFATTYALGHVAARYYAQERALSTDDLRELFTRLRDEAASLYPKIEERVRARAAEVDLDEVVRAFTGSR